MRPVWVILIWGIGCGSRLLNTLLGPGLCAFTCTLCNIPEDIKVYFTDNFKGGPSDKAFINMPDHYETSLGHFNIGHRLQKPGGTHVLILACVLLPVPCVTSLGTLSGFY
jgi:hypothetical protein